MNKHAYSKKLNKYNNMDKIKIISYENDRINGKE